MNHEGIGGGLLGLREAKIEFVQLNHQVNG